MLVVSRLFMRVATWGPRRFEALEWGAASLGKQCCAECPCGWEIGQHLHVGGSPSQNANADCANQIAAAFRSSEEIFSH